MTENKGAYINVGPDYKLDFHQFDAVPHPNIRPMVRTLIDTSFCPYQEPLSALNHG